MNFQVTVLKILVSYPDGFAPMAELKRDMAILATSGRDWAERTKRLAAGVPNLDIFSQKLVERINGGWRITEMGRAVLEIMEARPVAAEVPLETEVTVSERPRPMTTRSLPVGPGRLQHERQQELRVAGKRRRATRSRDVGQ